MNIDILKVGYLETNCYILTKNNKSLIIDPGDDENFIVSRIKKLNTTPIAIYLHIIMKTIQDVLNHFQVCMV